MLELSKLLNPKTIAIVGASNNLEKIGGIVLKNIKDFGYQGKIYPVNPNEETIQNINCYKSINDLPETIDLAIIAIPAEKAMGVLEEIAIKNIKDVLIFSAGFKEAGESGQENEKKLLEIAKKHNLNILGPNCLGFLNNDSKLNATFGKVPEKDGNLKILSQSGAIATSFFDWCQSKSLGINQFITLGNKSVLNENHFLENWLNQDISTPIGLYLESIADGQELVKIFQKTEIGSPIFILKPGKSPEAASAMKSHTGSLAGADDVLNTALQENNIIRAENLEDFFNLSIALSWGKIPLGPNLAIISNAGGPAVISADAVSESSLKLATLSEETQNLLAQNLPRSASLHNPVDVLGDALSDRFGSALEAVLKESAVNSVLVILTPQMMTQVKETAEIIYQKALEYQKPVYCSFIGGPQITAGEDILNDKRIPNFDYPESAIRTLSLIYNWQKNNQPKVPIPEKSQDFSEIDSLLNGKSNLLDTITVSNILEKLDVEGPNTITTGSLEIAGNFAKEVGWPVVLKTTEENLLHKSDSGGVATNINSFEKLRENWLSIQKDPDQKIQIQKQIKDGVEIIVGFKNDNIFGKCLFFGAGGKYVSLFGDKNLSLFPQNTAKVQKLIHNSKIFPLLDGYRGTVKLDIAKLTQTILKLVNLYQNCTRIKEMEVNPIIINQNGVYCVDTKIILS